MNPVTAEEAKAAGRKSLRAAVRYALKRWRWHRSQSTLPTIADVKGRYCALCYRYGYISGILYPKPCPLIRRTCVGACTDTWWKAKMSIYFKDLDAFHAAADQMIADLEALLR